MDMENGTVRMRPTRQWMAQVFNIYNKKYFGGSLKTPNFAVGDIGNEWGRYYLQGRTMNGKVLAHTVKDNGTITLNSLYTRSEKSLIETMLHEMIHQYVQTVLGKYPKNPHGADFMSMVSQINANGWNVSVGSEIMETDGMDDVEEDPSTYGNRMVKPSIIMILNKPDGDTYKVWICKAEYENLKNFVAMANSIKGVNSVQVWSCYSQSLAEAASDVNTLSGCGGQSLEEAVRNFMTALNGSPSEIDFREMKRLQ